MSKKLSIDQKTADAFATSWNNLPDGSIYTYDQFINWMHPLKEKDIKNKRVLELGCGNGSLMLHLINWKPSYFEGIDLGDSINTASRNLAISGFKNFKITRSNLTEFESDGFDVVYCIGVLHHLKNPKDGFDAVIRNVRKGGSFHCWVYAKEGNAVIIYLVDPLRKIVSKLPWWLTKYVIATPLAVPFYIYSNILSIGKKISLFKKLPLFEYSLWIAQRGFLFFRHVAFDQLVTPQTAYIKRSELQDWLSQYDHIDKESTYIINRNGNSWKFGGKVSGKGGWLSSDDSPG